MRSRGRPVRAAWLRAGFKADLAIVGEPTRSQVVTAHKGTLWLELETRGKSAHGSSPELGHNAVHDMARVVDLDGDRITPRS
jgi:succinyl-diaminopimelate desuccinylase